MNFFGGIVVAETRTSRLSQRSFNGRIPERCLSAVGFTPTLGEGESAFPLAIWFPRNKGGGRHSMEKHVGFAPEIVKNGNSITIKRAGLPDCVFVNGFCPQSREVLIYDATTGHYTLDSKEGVRYVFGSNAGENPAIQDVTFPSGMTFNCVLNHNNREVVFQNLESNLTLSIAFGSSPYLASASYKKGNVFLFSITLESATSNEITYICTRNGTFTYRLILHLQSAEENAPVGNIHIRETGAQWSIEHAGYDPDELIVFSYDHNRSPDTEECVLDFSELNIYGFLCPRGPFRASEYSFGCSYNSQDIGLTRYYRDGFCDAVIFGPNGEVESEISGVPWIEANSKRLSRIQNCFFDNDLVSWNTTGNVQLEWDAYFGRDIFWAPGMLLEWPFAIKMDPGASISRTYGNTFLADSPYALCFLVAPSKTVLDNESVVGVTVTMSLLDGTTRTVTKSFLGKDLSPGHPRLLFVDLSTSEGANSVSFTITNAHQTKLIAVTGIQILRIPVMHYRYDSSHRTIETRSATLCETMHYEGNNHTFSWGAASTPISTYDSSDRVTREEDSFGGASDYSYDSQTHRISSAISTSLDGKILGSWFYYNGSFITPYRHEDVYGNITEKQFTTYGGVASITSFGATASYSRDERGRMQEITFSSGNSSFAHSCTYGICQSTERVISNQTEKARMDYSESGNSGSSSANATLTWTGFETDVLSLAPYSGTASLAFSSVGQETYENENEFLYRTTAIKRFQGSQLMEEGSFVYDDNADLATICSYKRERDYDPALNKITDIYRHDNLPYLQYVKYGNAALGTESYSASYNGCRSVISRGHGGNIKSGDYLSLKEKLRAAGATLLESGNVQSNSDVDYTSGIPHYHRQGQLSFSGNPITAGALLYFSESAPFAGTVKRDGATVLSLSYSTGCLSIADGNSSIYNKPLVGWHAITISLGASGQIMFIDDVDYPLAIGSGNFSFSLQISVQIFISLGFRIGANWNKNQLYEYQRDAIGIAVAIPLPNGAVAYSSTYSHLESGIYQQIHHLPLDGTFTNASLSVVSHSNRRYITTNAASLSNDVGGPCPASRFRYDSTIGRKAYLCSGDTLAFLLSSQTLSLKLKFKLFDLGTRNDKRTLFVVAANHTPKIDCYIISGRLYLNILGTTIDTQYTVPNSQWQELIFRFVTTVTHSTSSEPDTTTIAYGLHIDGNNYTGGWAVSHSIGLSCRLHLGRDATTAIGLHSSPLRGLMSDLFVSKRDFAPYTISQLPQLVQAIRITNWLDSAGRVIQRQVIWPDSPASMTELIRYDTATRSGENYQTSLPTMQTFPGQTINYGRSSDGRLNSYNGAPFAVDYRGFVVSGMGEQVEYDDAGNITKRTLPNGLSANYSYDNKHRLLGFQIQTSYRTLSYDGDSLFPSSLNVQGQITSFTYYGAGALRSFTRGGVTYTFSYDEEGHCSQRTGTDGSVRLFHYEGGRLDFESVPGSWYAHYFYGEDGRPEFVDIFQNNIASRYFFLVDVYGTILKLLDFQGTEVANYQYGLFGDLTRTGTLPVPLSLAYKGYRYDAEAGLYILGCRAYDPCFGRFLSPDSPRYADFASPGGLNLYCYCRNNPVAYSDASGHMPDWAKWLIGGVTFGIAAVLTGLTGGALAPLFVGIGMSVVGGGLIGGVYQAMSGGDFWEGFEHGAADGAMWGGIFALGSTVLNIGLMARQGYTIGKTGTFEDVARLTGTNYYHGMKSFTFVKAHFGERAASTLGWAQNRFVIKTVMFFRGPIYNAVGPLTGSYAKEVALIIAAGYKYFYDVWPY